MDAFCSDWWNILNEEDYKSLSNSLEIFLLTPYSTVCCMYRMQLTNGGNMSRQTLLRCLISMYIISAAAMKTTTVKSCSELIAVLGTKDHANRIIVQGHLQCEREKDTDSVEIRKSIIIEGSDTSEIAPSIDWADTRALLVATGSVTITFRNLIFIQDSPGMTGISLSFLSAEKGASAVFEGV